MAPRVQPSASCALSASQPSSSRATLAQHTSPSRSAPRDTMRRATLPARSSIPTSSPTPSSPFEVAALAPSSSSSRRASTSLRWGVSALLVSVLVFLLAVSAPSGVGAQQQTGRNVTQQDQDPVTLVGTWSSGAGNVVTGLSFFNPGNNSFIIPPTAGQSYSFTADGYWEQALYIFQSNPGSPSNVQAQLIWQHGKFVQNSNGSITLWPFVGDGRQLVQSTATAQTETVQSYDQQEFMRGFYIRLDTHYGRSGYMLQMFGFDGTPKPPMWQVYNPPQMLPTQQLKQQVIGGLNFNNPSSR